MSAGISKSFMVIGAYVLMNNPITLVTGADGFIGSHLVESLVRSGQKVKAFVL